MTVFEKIKEMDLETMIRFLIEVSKDGFIDNIFSCNKCPHSSVCDDYMKCIYIDDLKSQYRGFLLDDCGDLEDLLNGEEHI